MLTVHESIKITPHVDILMFFLLIYCGRNVLVSISFLASIKSCHSLLLNCFRLLLSGSRDVSSTLLLVAEFNTFLLSLYVQTGTVYPQPQLSLPGQFGFMENEIELRSIADHTTPIVIEHDCGGDIDLEALENTMTAKLRRDSPLSTKCCIFRVPEVLRKHKPGAYGPDIVSIGPFHRGREQFAPMENVKQWYLHNLLSRLNISMNKLIHGIDNFITIVEFEKRAREFYAEPLDHISQNELIEMLILDGCFLIQLFRSLYFRELKCFVNDDTLVPARLDIENDPILNMDCMVQYLCHDLMLLENQLPWFVIDCLYSLTVDNLFPYQSLDVVVLYIFSSQASLLRYFNSYLTHILARHDDDEILHILDLARTAIVFGFKEFKSIPSSEVKLPPATTLSEAGVKFKKGSSDDGIMNIDFKDGVFTIPQLTIGEMIEPLFRNLIAFEQCCHGRSHKITSYAILMNNLIDSSKDVNFLCEKEIIRNWFSSESASQLFNKLYDDTFLTNFSYGELCAQVNVYYNRSWNRWLERLKRDYFSNPWKITSLVAAFIFLVLTLVQTAYTIQQYYFPQRL